MLRLRLLACLAVYPTLAAAQSHHAAESAHVVRGWGQLGMQFRTPVHELSLYAQAGVPFSGSKQVSYQIGLSHPLAPYTFHAGF